MTADAIIGVARVGAQSTLGGHTIFARKLYITNQQNARILRNNCLKNIFPNFRGARVPLPPSPTPMDAIMLYGDFYVKLTADNDGS